MGFFGEKLFGKKPAPTAEKIVAEVKNEDSEESVENTQVEDNHENIEQTEKKEAVAENKNEEGEAKPEGPAAFEISPALSSSLDKLINACSSGSPIDIEGALIKCESALDGYQGKKFTDSDASISVLSSLQKAINGAGKNFFLGMRKNTVMLQIGMLEKRVDNLTRG